MMRVGFVGLGSQGAPMARRILDAGHPTTLWARKAATQEPFADTPATTAASLGVLGAASDLLAVCVVDDAGVEEVLRGPDGALAAMADGSVVVIHSTVHPATCLRLQDDHPELTLVDAPVSGGGHKAAAGELLAKDVGIFADHAAPADSTLVATADVALGRMGTARHVTKERRA